MRQIDTCMRHKIIAGKLHLKKSCERSFYFKCVRGNITLNKHMFQFHVYLISNMPQQIF
jgi:hypothetical protein